jgi:anti-sigma regulatory factor (Ser/Thr protein kinase)
MTPASTYTARCWREGGSWVIDIVELDETVRTDRLSQVEAAARDAIARHGGDGATAADVVIDLREHDDLSQLLDLAASVREDDPSEEAAALRRQLAVRLAAEGFTTTEVGALLGVPMPQAEELVAGGPSPVGRSLPVSAPTGVQEAEAAIAKPHGAYQHEAFIYRGDEDFLAGTVPFVLDGVSLGQPVLVAVTLPRLVNLQAVVGAHAPGVEYVDMGELGANPARIIPAWRSFVEQHDGQPVRGIGEPVWAGRRATEIAECQLHEALLNLAVEPDTPLWLLCPYDADSLAGPVLDEAARSHPSLREGEHYRGSTTYGGVHHVDRLFAGRLPDPPPGTQATTFERADLAEVRRRVGWYAARSGLSLDRTTDLALAATEVATNSVRHGGGRGVLRLWRQGDAVVCEFTDRGRVTDPLAGRRIPPLTAEGGRGLWLANQLCDLVQIRSGDSGTVVRLLTWL